MDLREAADYLTARGYRCKSGTVRRLAKLDIIKHFRPGPSRRGHYTFNVMQLDAFLVDAEMGRGETSKSAPVRMPTAKIVAPAVSTVDRRLGYGSPRRAEFDGMSYKSSCRIISNPL